MSTIETKIQKFYRKPIPNDITFNEVETIARHFGCKVSSGGKHSKIVHSKSGTVIPVPKHGKHVKEAYVKQLKQLFDTIKEES